MRLRCLVFLGGALLFGCGASKPSHETTKSPRTALEKRAALLQREPTELEKEIEKSAEAVQKQIEPYGFSLDASGSVSSGGKADPSCRSIFLDEQLGALVRRALEQGERQGRLRLNQLIGALATCQWGFDSEEAHRVRLDMGSLLIQLGKPLAARKAFEEEFAWAEARYGRDSEKVASVLLSRIAALWTAGVLSEAYAFFEEHQAAIKRYFPQNYRSTTSAFGVLACGAGRTSLAREYAERMQRAYNSKQHAMDGFSISVAQIAGCLKRRGQKEESERLFRWALSKQESAEVTHTDPEDWTSFQVRNERGLLFEAIGDFVQAEKAYEMLQQRALAGGIPKETRAVGYAVTAWTGLARAEFEQGKLEQALATLKNLRKLPSEMYVDVLGPKVERGLGRYQEALSELDALEARSQGWGEWFRLTLVLERARVLWAQGKLPLARDTLQESLALGLGYLDVQSGGSESERRSALSHVRLVVDALVSMNLRSGPKDAELTEEAFSALLLTKGVLLDALSADFSKLRESRIQEDVDLLQALRQLRTSLAQNAVKDSEASFFALHLEIEAVEAQARERSRMLGADPEPITPKDVRGGLEDGEIFIEFIEFSYEDPKNVTAKPESHLAAYVVKRHGTLSVFDLGPSAAIVEAVEAARAELAPGAVGAAAKLKKLGALVLGPLESELHGAHTLRLAPDGALSRIPFAALRDNRGKYYLDRFLITYIGTGREWARLARTRTSIQARPGASAAKLRPIIIANPEFGERGRASSDGSGAAGTSPFTLSTRGQQTIQPLTHEWQALPGTGKEAQQLAGLFPLGKVFTRHDATEMAVKAVTHPDILHIASHGYFLPQAADNGKEAVAEDPLLHAGLVLAFANTGGRGSDDGFLTALEVVGLDLGGTQVATLSACETGLGEINGEGVFGLRRSLAIAGAESQLLSLWKVSDEATLKLMTEFYKRILRGESRQAALTSAERSMARDPKFKHPYYWSSFVLSGDPGVLRTKK
jgi:CHAT domain-containing protein/predicted negative regulator of RcsB-dependent stress response